MTEVIFQQIRYIIQVSWPVALTFFTALTICVCYDKHTQRKLQGGGYMADIFKAIIDNNLLDQKIREKAAEKALSVMDRYLPKGEK